jgi:hypothetical protein
MLALAKYEDETRKLADDIQNIQIASGINTIQIPPYSDVSVALLEPFGFILNLFNPYIKSQNHSFNNILKKIAMLKFILIEVQLHWHSNSRAV